ncbi:hypothetical protein ACP4OV_004044 [Aristida adscensionis]
MESQSTNQKQAKACHRSESTAFKAPTTAIQLRPSLFVFDSFPAKKA